MNRVSLSSRYWFYASLDLYTFFAFFFGCAGILFPVPSSPRMWMAIYVGYGLQALDVLLQGRKTQAYLLLWSAAFATLIRFDYAVWQLHWAVSFLLWTGFVLMTGCYVIGWLFRDSEMYRPMDNTGEYSWNELESGKRTAEY